MFDRILFPTDGGDGADVAFDHVLDVASAHEGTVHILNVADTARPSTTNLRGEVIDTLEHEGESVVADAADRAQARGVDVVTSVVQGDPYRTIVDYADEREMDLVAMPTQGRQGLERFLLGSTTERVVRRAETPVLTIPPDDDAPTYPYRDVLVPTDGSDSANRALETAIEVARDGTVLHLLTVLVDTALGVDLLGIEGTDLTTDRAEELLAEAETTARDAGAEPVVGSVERGSSAAEVILSYVDDHDVDLVALGTRGRTGVDRYLLGSVAESVIRRSPVPVLSVRE